MRRALLGFTVAMVAAVAIVCAVSIVARADQAPPAAQTDTQVPSDPTTCQGLLSQANRFAGVLASVSRYGSTYVLVVPERLASKVPNAKAPGIADLEVGVQSGTAAADVARAIGIRRIKEYAYSESAPVQPLEDIRDGKLDAAILWAPLAGLGIIELGLDGKVSVFSVDKPHAAPAALRMRATDHPCAAAIRDELDVNGVLPAELLVSVDLRSMLSERAPAPDLGQAREGGALFNQSCSQCHGPDAVADPHGLAPVDLRISITRFSYPGFHYIVLNGRPAKSMPPFRGTVTDDQIALIYQYLRARSQRLLPAAAP
jgi:mono/diheme cytochrome c family protein